MKVHFDAIEMIEYNNVKIPVRWKRYEYKKKSNIRIFKDDDGIILIEKDFISFKYNDIEISETYESDKHDLVARVWELCGLIEDGKFDELTAMNVEWKKNGK